MTELRERVGCRECGRELTEETAYKHGSRSSGLQARCKVCDNQVRAVGLKAFRAGVRSDAPHAQPSRSRVVPPGRGRVTVVRDEDGELRWVRR